VCNGAMALAGALHRDGGTHITVSVGVDGGGGGVIFTPCVGVKELFTP
jgi:hypothetical protein